MFTAARRVSDVIVAVDSGSITTWWTWTVFWLLGSFRGCLAYRGVKCSGCQLLIGSVETRLHNPNKTVVCGISCHDAIKRMDWRGSFHTHVGEEKLMWVRCQLTEMFDFLLLPIPEMPPRVRPKSLVTISLKCGRKMLVMFLCTPFGWKTGASPVYHGWHDTWRDLVCLQRGCPLWEVCHVYHVFLLPSGEWEMTGIKWEDVIPAPLAMNMWQCFTNRQRNRKITLIGCSRQFLWMWKPHWHHWQMT